LSPSMRGALSVYAGASARLALAREGWQPQLFQTMIGASGGAKFLALAHLDRYLFGDFLQRSQHQMHLIGSSIGSWRHAALTQQNPVKALEKLHYDYLHQYYEPGSKPSPAFISEVSQQILRGFLDQPDSSTLCNHARFCSHIVTARGLGPNGSDNPAFQALGLGQAAIWNSVHRKALQTCFQRVIFSSHTPQGLGFEFKDFLTLHVPLMRHNALRVLHASGSIPFVLTGERDIDGAPPGRYWDGGIVDYHFDLGAYHGDKLVLYPHFVPAITPGWFDKFLPWRRTPPEFLDKVVLLCPAPEYVAKLPFGKIPERGDIPRMNHQARVAYWQQAVDASLALADDFAALVNGPDPLANVKAF
jgi:hypothetical protein